ncbi:hypothetical protein ABH926_002147 [Catenulispora sp. GP43]|uniref:hypothetical protein n=1 Tax=Catenulispora sp. GP43 TaxID=3156263 RepID=UPI00351513F0
MALTRAGMRKQVIENLSQVAPPGERFVACVHCETGLSPWLAHVLERIPFVGGLIGIVIYSMRDYYFITLTNTSLVIHRAARVTNKPKEFVFAVPITASPITGIKKGWLLWSRMYFAFPGETKPKRLNFHRIWNSDVQHFITAMPHAVEGAEQLGVPLQVPGQGSYSPDPAPSDQHGQG